MSDEKLEEGLKCFPVTDLETGEVSEWTLAQVLDEINRDRSSEWTPYNVSDWQCGWKSFVQGDYCSMPEELLS